MNINCRLSMSDDQRRRLANLIDGKVTKRLATRQDVNAFVSGVFDQFDTPSPEVARPSPPASAVAEVFNVSNLSSPELAEVERLRGLDKPRSYVAGWLTAGRGPGAKRPVFEY